MGGPMDDINVDKKKIKQDRFKRIAERRTKKILNDIRLLSNCSNKINYDYTDEEVNKIFSTLDQSLKLAKDKFVGNKQIEFTL